MTNRFLIFTAVGLLAQSISCWATTKVEIDPEKTIEIVLSHEDINRFSVEDGVIVDTAVFHYQAWKKLCNTLGFDIDEEFNETLKGISRMDSLKAILKHGNVSLNQEEKEKYSKVKNDWYLELVNKMTENDILPGVKNFLEESRALGIKIALGSASKNASLIL